MSDIKWCVMQGGYPVASGFGPNDRAIAEMLHYATVYRQDGPVEMKTRIGSGRWKPYDDADHRE
jgi:hypothetical protein